MEQIISASGTQHGLIINPDGSINISGLSIGSLALSLENIYVTSGNVSITEQTPINSNKNNAFTTLKYVTSGTSTGVTGSQIGSIIQFIGAGSFVKVISYSNNQIVNIGSWS
jgi:6-phosphogluconate dehydrogenase (decarboxylating)